MLQQGPAQQAPHDGQINPLTHAPSCTRCCNWRKEPAAFTWPALPALERHGVSADNQTSVRGRTASWRGAGGTSWAGVLEVSALRGTPARPATCTCHAVCVAGPLQLSLPRCCDTRPSCVCSQVLSSLCCSAALCRQAARAARPAQRQSSAPHLQRTASVAVAALPDNLLESLDMPDIDADLATYQEEMGATFGVRGGGSLGV